MAAKELCTCFPCLEWLRPHPHKKHPTNQKYNTNKTHRQSAGTQYANLQRRKIPQPFQIPDRILPCLPDREPIPQKPKPIPLAQILIIVILGPPHLHHMKPMNPGPRMQRDNRPICRAVLIPRPTIPRPDGAGQERVRVLREFAHCGCPRCDGFYALCLDFFHHPRDIPRDLFGDGEHAPMTDWCMRK
ncbi:hypothetical protein BJX65DRAFT_282349 [Aspergillus insuetus]